MLFEMLHPIAAWCNTQIPEKWSIEWLTIGKANYNTVNIGKAMTNMEFASKTVHGYTKYLCVVIEDAEREEKQAQDAELI